MAAVFYFGECVGLIDFMVWTSGFKLATLNAALGSVPSSIARLNYKNFSMAYLATAATVVALATWHVHGAEKVPTAQSENVTAQTQQKVADLKLKFSNFKLSPDAQLCVDGKLIDPECEPTIIAEMDWHIREAKIAENKNKIAEYNNEIAVKEQQIAVKKTTRESIDIVMSLVQLWFYIDQDRQPPKDADYIAIVMNNPNTPKEVQSLFIEFLNRKKSGSSFKRKADGERIITFANKYLQIADSLKPQITNETVKNQADILYAQAADLNNKLKQIVARMRD